MSQFLHTMLRVGELQRSIDFYTKAFNRMNPAALTEGGRVHVE